MRFPLSGSLSSCAVLSPADKGAIAPEAVVTFDRLDGFRVVESFGLARGEGVVPRNLIRATFRSIGSLIGLTPIDHLTDAERARSESIAALARDAERMGANGIVNLRFDASEIADGSTRVLAFGEAVCSIPHRGSRGERRGSARRASSGWQTPRPWSGVVRAVRNSSRRAGRRCTAKATRARNWS